MIRQLPLSPLIADTGWYLIIIFWYGFHWFSLPLLSFQLSSAFITISPLPLYYIDIFRPLAGLLAISLLIAFFDTPCFSADILLFSLSIPYYAILPLLLPLSPPLRHYFADIARLRHTGWAFSWYCCWYLFHWYFTILMRLQDWFSPLIRQDSQRWLSPPAAAAWRPISYMIYADIIHIYIFSYHIQLLRYWASHWCHIA